jgi:hypothetical protein
MTNFRIVSIDEPIADSPEATQLLVSAVFRASLMNLLPEWVAARQEVTLDRAFVREFGEVVSQAGIGQEAVLALDAKLAQDPIGDGIAAELSSLWQALDDSPHPQGEWAGVRERLEDEQLARLLQISPSSLRRYASGQRETPDQVAWRLHTLTRIIAALIGSYNDYGVRRWFERPRAQLGGRSPAEVIVDAKNEDDPQLAQVIALAEALVGPALAA